MVKKTDKKKIKQKQKQTQTVIVNVTKQVRSAKKPTVPTKQVPSSNIFQPVFQPIYQPQAPIQPQVQAPVQPQVQAPVQPQVKAPVQPQVQAPVQPQVKAPVKESKVYHRDDQTESFLKSGSKQEVSKPKQEFRYKSPFVESESEFEGNIPRFSSLRRDIYNIPKSGQYKSESPYSTETDVASFVYSVESKNPVQQETAFVQGPAFSEEENILETPRQKLSESDKFNIRYEKAFGKKYEGPPMKLNDFKDLVRQKEASIKLEKELEQLQKKEERARQKAERARQKLEKKRK